MKTGKNCIVLLAVLIGILSITALCGVELPLPTDKPFLIGQPYPELAGIEKLYAIGITKINGLSYNFCVLIVI